MRVAAVQLVSGADPQANLVLAGDWIRRAADGGAELVVLPEATMRCFGRSLVDVAEPLDGPWATGLADLAHAAGVVVVAGMFTPTTDGRVTNTLRAVGPGVDAHYDKIHLFDAFGFAESDTVAPGAEPVTIEVAGVTVGLTTCYDVRFPGLYTALADRGAQIICVAASWGAGPGKREQWELLVRARALDATAYLVAAGQADPASLGSSDPGAPRTGNAPTGIGSSAVVSPYGEVLASLAAEPGLLVTDLDPAVVDQARRTLPVLANRRF